jgi:hypothetical protein
MSDKYLDGYKDAGRLVRLGNTIKIIGYVLGILIILIGFVAFIVPNSHNEQNGDLIFLASILCGAIIIFSQLVIGSVVSAFGHLIRATQDSAVNTASLLNFDE